MFFRKQKHYWQNWGTLIFLQTTGPLLVSSLHFHFQILPIKLPIIIKTCFAVKYTRKCFNEHKNGKCFGLKSWPALNFYIFVVDWFDILHPSFDPKLKMIFPSLWGDCSENCLGSGTDKNLDDGFLELEIMKTTH